MCGLGVIYSYNNNSKRVDKRALEKISHMLTNRGPDGAGEWISDDGLVGMVHRRLAILDLSNAGAQPMASRDGKIKVVFNGEIYNYPQLRKELEAKGYQFTSNSDTETLIHLYRQYGVDMVKYLRGMFSIALWDETQKGLLLARDPLGIKPLYYSDDGKTLRVASQVKALVAGGGINTSESPAGHVGFFLWGHVPEPYTLYEGINALPAGTILWIEKGKPRQKPYPYFDLGDELFVSEEITKNLSKDQVAEQFEAALKDSVGHHMQSDVPVGVFLSSGLDSSSIAVLAAEYSSMPLKAVTLGFEEYKNSQNDEIPLAGIIAKSMGFSHHTSRVTRKQFLDELEQIHVAMDQPTIDGVNSYFVSKAAKKAGLKVALSGLGGDELLGGYPSFKQIPNLVNRVSPFSFLGHSFRLITAPILRRFTSPKYASLLEYGGTYSGAYFLRRGLFMPWELPDLLDGELVKDGIEKLSTIAQLDDTVQKIVAPNLKVSALEINWYMRNQLLRDIDWAGMYHSLEVRTPLVDVNLYRSVVPLLLSKYPPGKNQMGLSLPRSLPKNVLNRPKTGFSIPVQEWMPDYQTKEIRGLRRWAKYIYDSFSS